MTIAELEASLETAALESPGTPAHVDALAALAWELRARDPQRTVSLSREAEAIARGIRSPRGLARSLLAASAGHFRLSELVEAKAAAEEALSLYSSVADQDGEAGVQNILGNILMARGDFLEALRAYERSLQLRASALDRRAEAATLSNIGAIYEKLGDYPRALEYSHRSLALAEEIGDQTRIATALTNIGIVNQLLGDSASATAAFQRGADAFAELGDRKHQAKCLNNLGVVCRDQGDYQGALGCYMAAHQVAAGIQDPETIALTLVNIGDAHRLLGNREEAGRTLLESLEAGRGAGNATLEMTARTELGTLRLETGDHDGAIEQGQAALDIATRCGYRQWIRNAHDVLAVAFENRGDLAKALSHWKAGQEIRTAMLKAQAEEASKSQKLRLELERARHEAEVQRLRHVELARANAELEEAGERLRRSDLEKSALVEQLREKSSLLEQQTKEDALTGLSNRRHLEQVLDHEFQRARRFGRPLTVLLVDIDHFKAINDAHSHAVGDAVLRRVAAVIRGACRAVDAVARYGGDEFVVVLPETGVQEGTRIGERIRRDVEALAAGDSWPSPPPTLSIGVADDSGRTRPGDVVEAADRALYEAKQQGRNQVVVSS